MGKGGHDVPGLLHEVYDDPQPDAGTEPPTEVPLPSRAGVALVVVGTPDDGHHGLHVGRHIYLHADLERKQHTLDRITPPDGRPGRYRAPDTLLAFLEAL